MKVKSAFGDLLDEVRKVVPSKDYDICSEAVLIDFNMQLLCHLVKATCNAALGLYCHSHRHAQFALTANPVGHQRTRLALLALLQHSHEEMGESDERRRVLKKLPFLRIPPDIGNA